MSINSQNSTGQTAMHLAAKWSRLNVIKLLIEAGADMEIKDRRGRTPFHEANDLISETAGLDSTIKKTQMDVMKSSIAARAFQIKRSGKNNDITTHEMEDALERLETLVLRARDRVRGDGVEERAAGLEAVEALVERAAGRGRHGWSRSGERGRPRQQHG